MNKEQAINKFLGTIRNEVGYHEGYDNQTKYAIESNFDNRLYGFDMNGSAWCDWFYDWAMCTTFGYELGRDMTYQFDGCCGAACRFSADYYKNHGAFYQYPEVGDQVFFYYGGEINHTGAVESIDGEGGNWRSFTSIEGNSSDMVRRNTYNRGNSCLAGFGRPNWSLVSSVEEKPQDNQCVEQNNDKVDLSRLFLPGDVVIITGDTYYTGVKIPDWVKQKRWVIMSVYGDRAVINKDEEGTMSIMSPININDIKLAKQDFVQNTQVAADPKVYVVKAGDSLWNIAWRELKNPLRYKEIKKLNNLESDRLTIGQKLLLP